MNLNRNDFWPPNAFRFGGGSTGQAQNIAQTPVPATAAPATASSAEVMQAQQDQRRQALKKRGFSKTIYAGDTGGWSANSNPSPTNPKVPNVSGGMGARTLGT